MNDFERDWIRLSAEEQRKQWAVIGENHGMPFSGDTRAFHATLWEREKTRIDQFLATTVAMLETELAQRTAPSP